jgi:hypothetical protein
MGKLIGLFLGSCLAATLFAQGLTSVAGTTKDPSGAVIPGATVVLVNADTGAQRSTAADSQGRYSISQMQPGTYRITAKAPGFADVSVEVQLQVNSPATVDLNFEKVGTVATSVSVAAEATLVNTTDATIGNAVGTHAITQLPFEARNVVGLLSIQPGVIYLGEPDTGKLNDYRSGAVNGGKSDQANVTLDGVDVNDQQNRGSFTSVLRVTLDAVQEFRTVTTNAGAEYGHSSGAQVSLISKSGGNIVHGSAYEYLRNTLTSANTFFNNKAGVPRQRLNRNVYGASVGGPVKKNKLFYFLNYEGRQDRSDASGLHIVPTDAFREGIFTYARKDKSIGTLTPEQVKAFDPLGIGEDKAVLAIFNQYPHSNDSTVGDGLNTSGFRFNAAAPLRFNTYISKIDYQLNAKNQLFWRGNLQNDRYANGIPQFPGQGPASVYLNNSKGLATGLTTVISPSLVSTFRYGFTRAGNENTGSQKQSAAYFDAIDPLYPIQTSAAALTQIIPVHDFKEDLVWNKGAHTISFGGEILLINNHYSSTATSFNYAYADGLYLINDGADLLPADAVKSTSVELQVSNLLGYLTKLQHYVNYDLNGNILPDGTLIKRIFSEKHYDLYAQDSWKALRGLTISAGLRVSFSPAITETQGYNVNSTMPLANWFYNRAALANAGQSQAGAGQVVYDLASKTGRGLYPFQRDWAPRFAIAYSPQGNSGLSKFLFGGPDRTSIRAGWGMFYDAFGQGLERSFSNSVGFSTLVQSGPGQPLDTPPRFTGFYDIPISSFPAAPPGGFPQVVPNLRLQARTIDDQLKAPYTMNLNVSIGRQLAGGFFVQASFVNRESRRSLIGEDIGAPTNLVDPTSGMSYFQAAGILGNYALANTPVANVPNVAFWQNMWPGAAGGGLTATQGIYKQFLANVGDWTTALLNIDGSCNPSCSKLGPNAMFNSQFIALYAFRSIAKGDYNGGQFTIRKSFGQGYQFDFNYTYSKCQDWGSTPESTGADTSIGSIFNSYNPSQMKAVCSYDATHQFSSLAVAELPFGRGKKFLNTANPLVNGALGGWQISGVFRNTSGYAASVINGVGYPTLWDYTGNATQIGVVPAPQRTKNAPAAVASATGGPNIFANPAAALGAYGDTMPGDSGQRNGIRGDGFFGIDLGLSKRFRLFALHDQPHTLQFRAEGFNITNTTRFDIATASLTLANPAKFGQYTQVLNQPRIFQFSARYDF